MPGSVDIWGTGNIAYHYARAIFESPFELGTIHGRSAQKLRLFLTESSVDAGISSQPVEAVNSDYALLCVADHAIEDVLASYDFAAKTIIIHCSGATDLDPFVKAGKHRHGVIYPYQTLTKGNDVVLNEVPLFIEGSDPKTLEQIRAVATCMSQQVHEIDAAKRLRLHLAAVFATNFSNAMYAIAEDLLKEVGEDFEVMHHLVEMATKKALEVGPAKAQTGPAVRRDVKTMEKHLKSLSDSSLKQIYRVISERISQA